MLYVSVPFLFLSFPQGLKKGVFEDSYSDHAAWFPTTISVKSPDTGLLQIPTKAYMVHFLTAQLLCSAILRAE